MDKPLQSHINQIIAEVMDIIPALSPVEFIVLGRGEKQKEKAKIRYESEMLTRKKMSEYIPYAKEKVLILNAYVCLFPHKDLFPDLIESQPENIIIGFIKLGLRPINKIEAIKLAIEHKKLNVVNELNNVKNILMFSKAP